VDALTSFRHQKRPRGCLASLLTMKPIPTPLAALTSAGIAKELHLRLEVINPTPEQKQAVEDARARFDQQVPETIQHQAGLWALDYFERTHRVILSLYDDESAVNRVIGDVEQAARRFFPDDALMRLWFFRFASVDIISHGEMALESLRRGDGLKGLGNWLGFYREVLNGDPACFDRFGRSYSSQSVGPARVIAGARELAAKHRRK
jgi:hypothetical protein